MSTAPVSVVWQTASGTRLEFHPPGYASPIALPVITKGSRKDTGAWTWNGSTEKPTLKPSIKTQHSGGLVSHIWLADGMCQYLNDSTCGNAGKTLPLQPLIDYEAAEAARSK